MRILWRKYLDAGAPGAAGGGGTPTPIEIKTMQDVERELIRIRGDLEAKAKADAKAEVTAQIKAVNDQIALLPTLPKDMKPEDLTKLRDDLAITVKAFDLFQSQFKGKALPGGNAAPENIYTEFGRKMAEREKELKEFKFAKKGFGDIKLENKAVGNISVANTVGTYFVQPTLVPGVQLKLYETVHMRDILPVGNTNSDTIRYVRDNGGEGGPTTVAMGATKPQMDRDLQMLDAPVRKIATYFRVPEEMIDDIPYLQSFLVQIGLEEVMLYEDMQILYGDGTGQNLLGLMPSATAFAAGVSAGTVTDANNFDVLMAAKKQGRMLKTNPTVALVSPIDYFDMVMHKDSTNNYLFLGGGNGLDVQGVLRAKGLPVIIEHTSVAAGDFLVLDPRNAAIFDRAGTTVRFYDQDQDNAIRNLITIVIEKRLALPIFRTDGLIKGTFVAGRSALNAA